MPTYQEAHWNIFKNAEFKPQSAVGDVPARWAEDLPNAPTALPSTKQTRQEVQSQCREKHVDALFAYACAMAWGGQNDRFERTSRPGHKTLAWKHRHLILPKLQVLRGGRLTHCQAYNLFSGPNSIPGLGPAFFTKLIYFFSPPPPEGTIGFYIMDQWTAKSVDLLTQRWVVRLARSESTSPTHINKSGNYEAFCVEVEKLAEGLGLNGPDAGDQVEQRLMSEGGHKPQTWRKHVKQNWPSLAPLGRYNAAELAAIYRLPADHF